MRKKKPTENGFLFLPEKFAVYYTSKQRGKLIKIKRYYPVGEPLRTSQVYRLLHGLKKFRDAKYIKEISMKNLPLFKLSRPMLKVISDQIGRFMMTGWEWRDKTEV